VIYSVTLAILAILSISIIWHLLTTKFPTHSDVFWIGVQCGALGISSILLLVFCLFLLYRIVREVFSIRGVKPSNFLIFVFLIVLSIYTSLYTISAHHIANKWAYDTSWLYSGDMTFFPWPKEPQGILLPVITKMNPIDEFIYLHLIKTGILILICLGLWMLTAVYCFKIIPPLIKCGKPTRSRAKLILIELLA